MVPALLGLSVGVGCAHQPTNQAKDAVSVQQQEMLQRFEEMERTNGRLSVRIEELEDQLFLLQDMTESNRIALRRHGYMQRGTYLTQNNPRPNEYDRARAPGPTPESYSGSSNPYNTQVDDGYEAREAQRANRNIRRIELPSNNPAPAQHQPQQPVAVAPAASKDEGVEVVITDEQFRDFVGDDGRRAAPASGSASNAAPRKGRAQAPVTDEKLGVSDKSSSSAPAKTAKSSASSAKKSGKNSLAIYKAALADYRGGNYAQALAGFEEFLASDPNPNYIDNGLYWIGECHYGLGDYQQATASFQRVLSEQPDGNKVPDAILKMSLAYERMNNLAQTRELLEKLTDRYPTTNAGRLGAQKLAELPERPLQN
ncbi:tol-pal system protein YbgF [Bradymonas sediminis]|uniref:Tol-pal system protein YbgF n=2 Tax=Bradymonas sediminis TaxID=1548548 RepID=A0A2Z4FK26_9DELT|nr:tol-pal system protein YbgF [Bradymonas sediminis]